MNREAKLAANSNASQINTKFLKESRINLRVWVYPCLSFCEQQDIYYGTVYLSVSLDIHQYGCLMISLYMRSASHDAAVMPQHCTYPKAPVDKKGTEKKWQLIDLRLFRSLWK